MILAGGQGTAFGVASLVVTVGIVVYNGTKLQEVLGKTWAEIKKVHEKEYAAVYAPLYFLTLTDMELLCLFPWKRDHSHGTDGFPHPDALKAAHGSGFVEDCLQIFCWVLHCAVTQDVTFSGVMSFVTSIFASLRRMGTQVQQKSSFFSDGGGSVVPVLRSELKEEVQDLTGENPHCCRRKVEGVGSTAQKHRKRA